MIAKQYSVELPADYDMELIRDRVSELGRTFDNVSGLALKAFLVTEKSRGARVNRYAPFCLWSDVSATTEFLYGDGFAGVTESFGRPLVEHWLGTDIRLGDVTAVARSATREDRLVADASLAEARDLGREWLEECTRDARGLWAAVIALDPYRWQFVCFALWSAAATATSAPVTTYELLHLSCPGLERTAQPCRAAA
jgi:hypothetical protein